MGPRHCSLFLTVIVALLITSPGCSSNREPTPAHPTTFQGGGCGLEPDVDPDQPTGPIFISSGVPEILDDDEANELNQNRRLNRHIRLPNADISVQDGSLAVKHRCVTYRSYALGRGIELVYKAEAASVKPVIVTTLAIPNAFQGSFDSSFVLRNLQGTPIQPEILGKVNVSTAEPVRYSMTFDATALTTGVYGYTLDFAQELADSQVATSGLVIVRNELDSPIGVGWSIAEVHTLFPTDDGSNILIVQGNGSNIVFEPSVRSGGLFFPGEIDPEYVIDPICTGPNCRVVFQKRRETFKEYPSHPPGDFSSLGRQEDGSYVRSFLNGSRHHFDRSGRIVSKLDRNGNETKYEYNGPLLSSITDRVLPAGMRDRD